MRRARMVAGAVVFAVAVLGAGGCGGSDDAAVVRQQTLQKATNLVSERDIEAQPADSPERAVMMWWRGLQFRDAATVRRLFSAAARREIGGGLPETVFLDLGPSLQTAKPEVTSVERDGDSARVYVTVRRNQVVSPKLIRQTLEYLGLTLVEEDGAWRIDDPTFFLQSGRILRDARLKAAERSGQ